MNIDINQALTIIPRSLLSLSVLFVASKLMGKKQASQLSLFDYMIGISIGNFAAEHILNFDDQFLNGIVAVIVFSLVSFSASYFTMKSIYLRRFLIGSPRVLVEDGKIITKSLKKEKIDINDLLQQCREQGYFDIAEVSYAILEVNGKLSILPKSKYKQITIDDLNIKIKKESLTANLIIDGKILMNNLNLIKKEEKWLKKELKKYGIDDYHNIILATLKDDKLSIYENNENIKKHTVLE